MSRDLTVAIIGVGSRGLSVLERILTLAKRAGPAIGRITVALVDPRCDGAGVHATDQPDYLLLNTTCAQVSMFPDAATVGDELDAPGPSLYEWATARGLRLAADGYTVGGEGRPLRPTDFLPRRLLGEYLGWFLDELRRRAPEHVQLRTHPTEAVDLAPAGEQLVVTLATGDRLEADYAFLTTGYTPNRRPGRPRLISDPYPLPSRLAGVRPGQTVAIGGFGLSAMDIMSTLTVGRGGRFVQDGDQTRYLPSGAEPVMLFYSRSGLPCRARPRVMRVDGQYQPVAFTPAAIDALRAERGDGRLDFDRDVLPLIYTEMRVAYRRCEAALAGPAAVEALAARLATAPDLTALLDQLDAERGRFDPVSTLDGSAGMLRADSAAYQKWFAEVVKADLAEGALGFAGSPVKAALDVLRALRDTFRYAIDYGGLTDDSLESFHRTTVPVLNRAVVGPQYERHCELLALLSAGLAHTPFGPAPAVSWDGRRWTIEATQLDTPAVWSADWLCAGNLTNPAVADSASPLLRSLHRRGLLRPHRPGSPYVIGADIDRDHHPIGRDGAPYRRLWLLGPLCEGATFYNNLVPSPGTFSRPVFDAHRCAAELLGLSRPAGLRS
ncbi:MAG TPA: FAD/NAD(P)-binding protein [Natronosporangium sp.]